MIDQCAMKGHDGRTTLPTTTTTVLEIPSQDRPRYKSRFANYQGVVQKIRGQDEVGGWSKNANFGPRGGR